MTLLRLEGEIEAEIAALLSEQLAALTPEDAPVQVELSDATIDDGAALTALVDQLRATAARVGRVELHHAPQCLAHVLYRIGALGDRIQLIEPREELPRSS